MCITRSAPSFSILDGARHEVVSHLGELRANEAAVSGAVRRTFDYGADVVPGSALASHDST
jgi:hypothetical protein